MDFPRIARKRYSGMLFVAATFDLASSMNARVQKIMTCILYTKLQKHDI